MIKTLNISGLSLKAKIVWGLVGTLCLYGSSLGISYLIFSILFAPGAPLFSPVSKLVGETSPQTQGGTVACPLNGLFHPTSQAEKWNQRRPLGVVLDNIVEARPQSGLSRADIIYEVVAEGGITRFMPVFLCQDAGDITPVRSARTYYLIWISEYDGLFSHVGGAGDDPTVNPKVRAMGQIREWKIKDIDQFSTGFPTYWRGSDRFAPHNVHTTTSKLWELAAKKGWGAKDEESAKRWDETFRSWVFKDDLPKEQRGATGSAKVNFWSNQEDYAVTWKYDPDKNIYLRFHKDQAQIDLLTQEQIAAKNVIVQFVPEEGSLDKHAHIFYKLEGKGEALIFQDGKAIVATWQKSKREGRTIYLDPKGKEIAFNRGLIFIQTVPTGAEVTY
jgi:hypothetical protein